MRYLFCLGISMICFTCINLLAKETKTTKEWFYNHPQCPIKININESSLRITNVSDKIIHQYQLGCVKNDKNFTVISKMMPVIVDLGITEVFINTVDDVKLPLFYSMKACHGKDGQITVLEVLFDGGDKWQYPLIQK